METLPFDAPLPAYDAQARALLDGLEAGDRGALERFKWEHPRFRDRRLSEVRGAELGLHDARLVVAHDHGFHTWEDLAAFTESVAGHGPVRDFELAVEAVVEGDVEALRAMVRADPALVRARSTRRHHATLLHYVAANGVENVRQRTPANALEVATVLLDGGAEVDALCDAYEEKCTTMSLLVSSAYPAQAGVQVALVELLLDRGAAAIGPGTAWQSTMLTALSFGFPDVAEALAWRGTPVDDLPTAAGLGRLEEAARLVEDAAAEERHAALVLAAMHGHAEVVALLLDAGEDPDRYNPPTLHAHATPLHQAVAGRHLGVVRLLVERGARLDLQDRIWEGTPLDWAVHLEVGEVADYLRQRGAPTT